MLGDGWEALSEVREWSGYPPGCQGVVERPCQMSGSGREALKDAWGWLRGPPGCAELVGGPS